jgi:protein-disulfide isomerase
MTARSANRPLRAVAAILGVTVTLLMCGPAVGVAHAAAAGPAGDVISIGDPNALGQIDLFVDPLCPYSGQMVQAQGDEIGRRLEAGTLRVNLRFVDFLDKYSASGTYDSRAIYATYVVADSSRASDITWRFVQLIYAEDQQPQEEGPTDLNNDQLAELANRVGAPRLAQDLIRIGLPIGFDPHVIAANNLTALRQFPEPGVPLVVINGRPVDGNSDWLADLPG